MSDDPNPQNDDTGDGGEGDNAGKTYTKKELDAITAKAVAKATKPFSNYADLQAAQEELEALKAQSLTAEERMRQQHDKAVRERDVAVGRAERAVIRQAIVAEAARQGAVDPDAVAALVDKRLLSITAEDEVEGVEEAVKALLASKSYLKTPGSRRSGTDFSNTGGGQGVVPVVTRSQHRQWLREGMTPEHEAMVEKAMAAGTYQTDR